VQNFSNHALGANFKPYKKQFSLQTSAGKKVDMLEEKFM
jgi:hypothetical protein